MAARGMIRTPDQRLRVFVSSTLGELADERGAARAAIASLRLTPVMFELGARPHPPRELYRSYLAQSDVLVGVYWQSYGWVGPGMAISGIEDEHELAGARPRLLYVKEPAPERDPRLQAMIDRIESGGRDSYRTFTSADELGEVLRDDLALLLTERFARTADPDGVEGAQPAPWPPLPTPATSFVGREAEVDAITDRLARSRVRLVTLTGPGGIGKTRLALEVATRAGDAFPGGVASCALAGVREPDRLLPAIASALSVTVDRNRAAVEALAEAFHGPATLLLVDNLEQVVDGAAELVGLLERCPTLTILATSRSVLRVTGEHEIPVAPLATAPRGTGDWVMQLASSPALQLFADRAAAVRPDFALDEANVLAVAEICRRLDGLPLAIELAAARVRLLPPAALLTRLGTRLDALGTGPADLPARQRTLRATIEWSLDLLDARTARRLEALAVFVDGWTTDAAAAVWELDDLTALEVLDALLGHSLLHAPVVEGEPRFGMLATVGELLAERLDASPDHDAVRSRHAAWYRDLVARADVPLRTSGADRWRDVLEREHGNLRAATRWTLDHEDLPTAAAFLRRQFMHWWMGDHLREGWTSLTEALAKAGDAAPGPLADLLVTAGMVAMELGLDSEARESAAAAVAAARQVEDPYIRAQARLLQAWIPASRTATLTEATRHLDEAIAIMERTGDWFMLGMALTSRGLNRFLLSQHDAAIAEQRRAVELGRASGNRRVEAQATTLLGLALLASGRTEEGAACLDDGAARFLALDDSEGVALCLSVYALVASDRGELERAASALGAADAQRRLAGLSVWPTLRPLLDRTVEEVRAELGPERFADAAAVGASQSRREAVAAAAGRRDLEPVGSGGLDAG
jgi:predicted ATPase